MSALYVVACLVGIGVLCRWEIRRWELRLRAERLAEAMRRVQRGVQRGFKPIAVVFNANIASAVKTMNEFTAALARFGEAIRRAQIR